MYKLDTDSPTKHINFFVLTGGANSSMSINPMCIFSHGNEFIEKQFPGALSWFHIDFLILYAFVPGLAIIAILSFKIREIIISR